jgi:CheY-like chemotaxis protein
LSQSEEALNPDCTSRTTVVQELLLVVDDDASVLQVASKVLQRGGYEVLSAGGGAEALSIAAANEGRISLLLTDVVMPGMGGRELSEIFRARFPAVRILFMSAYTEDEVILQGVRVADVDFIPKPFTVQGLRDKVRYVLDRNGAE